MADSKLSALPAGAAVADADLFYTSQSLASKKVTATQLKTYSLTPPITLAGGTVTSNTPVLTLTETWNNGAVAFDGMVVSITDTAKANASSLFALDTTSRGRVFSVEKGVGTSYDVMIEGKVMVGVAPNVNTGQINVANLYLHQTAGVAIQMIYNANGTDFGIFYTTNSGSVSQWNFGSSTNASTVHNTALSWDENGVVYIGGSFDVPLLRESSGVLAQRDGTNAQGFRLYNTYSSGGTNYERGIFDWNLTANILTIGAQAGGSGTGRGLNLITGNGLLAMVGQSLGGTSSGTGFLMALGYNAVNNKQYWLGDPDYLGNGASRFVRMASFSGLTYLSGVDGTNSTNLPVVIDVASWLTFGGQTSGNCGINYDVITGPDYGTVAAITGDASAYADFRAKTLRTSDVAVASLPAAGNKGRRYFVNNATATTFASIVAGGGTNNVPVYDDGTNWRIG